VKSEDWEEAQRLGCGFDLTPKSLSASSASVREQGHSIVSAVLILSIHFVMLQSLKPFNRPE